MNPQLEARILYLALSNQSVNQKVLPSSDWSKNTNCPLIGRKWSRDHQLTPDWLRAKPAPSTEKYEKYQLPKGISLEL